MPLRDLEISFLKELIYLELKEIPLVNLPLIMGLQTKMIN